MKTIGSISATITLALLLAHCSTSLHSPVQTANNYIQKQEVAHFNKEIYPAKNPQQVALYRENQNPHTGYRIIGRARVARYNLFGMARTESTVNQMLKSLAASIGGDGLINLQDNQGHTEANVIAYQTILF